MTELPTMSLMQINVAIERADTSRSIAGTLVLLKNEKKRKETDLCLSEKHEDVIYIYTVVAKSL